MTVPNSSLDQYHYDLPASQIAKEPVTPRDSSRLLVLHRASGQWEHRKFSDLPQYLDSNDLLVVNNTRVMKARLKGYRIREDAEKGGRVEFVLLEKLGDRVWEGLLHASARYLPGLKFEIPLPDSSGQPGERGAIRGQLLRGSAESPSGTVVVEFDRDPIESGAGELPLPHYLGRSIHSADESQYQTVYSKVLGSAAAPTAGLHFTEQTRRDLESRGVNWQEITLHVGLGTFRPVKTLDIHKHVMHEERFEIDSRASEAITNWKKEGRRVLAVGTTSVRTLESAWQGDRLQCGLGRTSLFIRPGIDYQFQVVDRLLTNFHLPQSTLLMLVCTFAGREFVLSAYQEAVREGYRFFSYGDAMLVL